jgi:hypothetical protein
MRVLRSSPFNLLPSLLVFALILALVGRSRRRATFSRVLLPRGACVPLSTALFLRCGWCMSSTVELEWFGMRRRLLRAAASSANQSPVRSLIDAFAASSIAGGSAKDLPTIPSPARGARASMKVCTSLVAEPSGLTRGFSTPAEVLARV